MSPVSRTSRVSPVSRTSSAAGQAATGALIGLALGDALGYPTEFDGIPSILATHGPWREMALPRPALVTDDTQMTLALGRALRTVMDRGILEPVSMAAAVRQEFVAWYHSPDNNRAPGNTCLTACGLLDSDRPWQQASRLGSKGCGANMRVAPLGLVPGLSTEQRAGAAQLQSALTHGHPTALAASDLTAHAVFLLAHGAEPTGLVGQLRSYAIENRTRYHERWLGDLWTYAGDAGGATPAHFMARGWDDCLAVLDRLVAALRAPSPETDPCLATGRAGSRRKPSPPRCTASCSSPTNRSWRCAGQPAPVATPTRSPAWRAPSPVRASAPASGRVSGRNGSSTTGNCWRSARSGTPEQDSAVGPPRPSPSRRTGAAADVRTADYSGRSRCGRRAADVSRERGAARGGTSGQGSGPAGAGRGRAPGGPGRRPPHGHPGAQRPRRRRPDQYLVHRHPDLHSAFPAAAARGLGIVDVPLICAQELDIAGAMPRVVRILAHIESDLPRSGINHVYLGAAGALRKDIAQ